MAKSRFHRQTYQRVHLSKDEAAEIAGAQSIQALHAEIAALRAELQTLTDSLQQTHSPTARIDLQQQNDL
jgi:hypothetical protein